MTEIFQSPSTFANFLRAALFWFAFGFKVIPLTPGTKKTAVKWDPWLEELATDQITRYWQSHPGHELGFIVGDEAIVFDADSPESIAALAEIERAFDLTPLFVVKTKKGEHHYYRRASGSFAKSDAHGTDRFPDRIDVKTGRSMVILPPTPGKEIEICEAKNIDGLSEISQEVIDAIFRHNGREAPRPDDSSDTPSKLPENSCQNIADLQKVLNRLDPDCGYDDWLHALMAIYHETGGSEEGLRLADEWSSKGKKYQGMNEISTKWKSFKSDIARPITIATLIKRVKGQSDPGSASNQLIRPKQNALDKFSLTGRSSEIERTVAETKPFLGQIALIGQATVFYAAPNSGKTLLTLKLLTQALKLKRIEPSQVYYLNMDDTAEGLLTKVRIAEEFGFHMLSEGFNDFTAEQFVNSVHELIDGDQAKGVAIILDTLKKFTDLMSKQEASKFSKLMRQFVLKGGTVIALAHTNKNPGPNGKPKYSGTSDIVDDFDCAYTIQTISEEDEEKVIEFENIKRRGNVVNKVAYRYSTRNNIEYPELLSSVRLVDEAQATSAKAFEDMKSDTEITTVIEACIREGFNTKMKLAKEVARRCSVGRQQAIKIIDKYGKETTAHQKWKFTVGARGAQIFELVSSQSEIRA